MLRACVCVCVRACVGGEGWGVASLYSVSCFVNVFFCFVFKRGNEVTNILTRNCPVSDCYVYILSSALVDTV